MPRERMTPKERWLAVLNHELPDRVPMDYWATEEATEKLLACLGCSTLQEAQQRLHIDVLVGVGPRYVGPPRPEDQDTCGRPDRSAPGCPWGAFHGPTGKDMYGRRHRLVHYPGGTYKECVYHPLARYDSVEEIEANYVWPSPDWFDYSSIPAQIEGKEAYPIRGGGSEPFLLYKGLRGQEQAFMDLVLNPDMVHYCLDKLFDFCYENTRRIYEQIPGKVNISYVAEDMGAQQGLLMSLAHIREFLLPRMKRMMDLVHEAGAYVFYHSDGAVLEVVPDMIEAGIDILNPIQWRCKGMDRQVLKDRFGDEVTFHGAVDNQYTLAFGSVEEVKEEVADDIRILGRGGGYILAPCHNIQAVSPPENIVAMYETGYELGWY